MLSISQEKNLADDSSPDMGNFEHLRRVTILSSPLYEVIYTTGTLGV